MDELERKLIEICMDKLGAPASDLAKRREDDQKLLDAFKKNPTTETFTPLYQTFKPMLFSAARSNFYNSPLPQSAHMAYAAQNFLNAIRTHKPELGPFRNHAYGAVLQQGKRLNLKYQNIGYIPEVRATKYSMFSNTQNLLKEELGREPSTLEMADELKWSPKMVETMRKEIRKDLVLDESKADKFGLVNSDKARRAFQDIQYSLIPAHQSVLEHVVGLNGHKALTKPGGGADLHAISHATGLTVPKIRSALKTITRKYKQYHGVLDLEQTGDFGSESEAGTGEET